MSGPHLTLDEIRACARGEDESLIAVVAEHCAQCDECASNLTTALAIIEYGPAAKQSRLLPSARVAAAAALVIALGVATMVAIRGSQPAEAPSLEDQLAALATTETIDPMLVRIHLGIASPAGSDNTVARLQEAGLDLAEERYEEAIPELEIIYGQAPDSHLVAAYLGIARYLSGDNSTRVRQLLTLGSESDNSSVSSFAIWYLGNYLLRVGEIEEARGMLSSISHLSALPGRLSKQLLERLREIDP